MIAVLTVMSGMDLSHDYLRYGWDGSGRVTGSSWFGLWYAAGAKPVCMILGLVTGGMPVSSVGLATGGMSVSSVGFGHRWDACERWSVWL
jgi:hypothetical protein